MKKILFMFATAALVLSACSNDAEVAVNDVAQQYGPGVVAFDTYTSSATKAAAWSGKAGVMNTTSLKDTEANGGGFGVFATYSDGTPGAYAPAQGPNFMYNQKVLWNSTALGWEYSPLKYWPNETAHDSQSPQATMDTRVDKLTFFAYAPFVASSATASDAAKGELAGVTYETGTPAADQYGIIKITANDATTDPKVTYRVSKDATKTVDLLWGVAPAGGLNYTAVNGTNIAIDEGEPLIDLIKPAKDQKIKFLFQHALSRINFTVVGAFDNIAPGGKKDANTKILVEKVDVFEGTAGSIKTDGVLNLNNGTSEWTANWETKAGGDYRSAALFSVATSELTTSIKDGGEVAYASQQEGVTTTEKPLFADASKFFAVIPNDDTEFVFEITYYTQTNDPSLATSTIGSRVKNVVRVPVTVDLKNNKSYNFRLIIGMTSVKLEAEVADWELAGDVDANLPQNTAE